MVQWTMQKKKARQYVHVDTDKPSKEEDSDGGDNDDDNEMDNVGSNAINTYSP